MNVMIASFHMDGFLSMFTGGILATTSTTNLQRAGESRFIKHQTQGK
jgi:hypothetical protein